MARPQGQRSVHHADAGDQGQHGTAMRLRREQPPLQLLLAWRLGQPQRGGQLAPGGGGDQQHARPTTARG